MIKMDKWRSLAMLGSGLMVHEVMVHLWFIIDKMLPLKSVTFGITIDSQTNMIVMLIDTIILLALVYFAWIKK